MTFFRIGQHNPLAAPGPLEIAWSAAQEAPVPAPSPSYSDCATVLTLEFIPGGSLWLRQGPAHEASIVLTGINLPSPSTSGPNYARYCAASAGRVCFAMRRVPARKDEGDISRVPGTTWRDSRTSRRPWERLTVKGGAEQGLSSCCGEETRYAKRVAAPRSSDAETVSHDRRLNLAFRVGGPTRSFQVLRRPAVHSCPHGAAQPRRKASSRMRHGRDSRPTEARDGVGVHWIADLCAHPWPPRPCGWPAMPTRPDAHGTLSVDRHDACS